MIELCSSVLIIGAHADDMELGCGALVQSLAENQIPVTSVVVASEREGRRFGPEFDYRCEGRLREEEAHAASGLLGIRPPVFLRHYIAQIDYKLLCLQIQRVVKAEKPGQIITHFPVDTHFDHTIISTAVYDIVQDSRGDDSLFFFRSPDSYSFHATHYFVGDATLKSKLLKIYMSQKLGDGNPAEEFIEVKRRPY